MTGTKTIILTVTATLMRIQYITFIIGTTVATLNSNEILSIVMLMVIELLKAVITFYSSSDKNKVLIMAVTRIPADKSTATMVTCQKKRKKTPGRKSR